MVLYFCLLLLLLVFGHGDYVQGSEHYSQNHHFRPQQRFVLRLCCSATTTSTSCSKVHFLSFSLSPCLSSSFFLPVVMNLHRGGESSSSSGDRNSVVEEAIEGRFHFVDERQEGKEGLLSYADKNDIISGSIETIDNQLQPIVTTRDEQPQQHQNNMKNVAAIGSGGSSSNVDATIESVETPIESTELSTNTYEKNNVTEEILYSMNNASFSTSTSSSRSDEQHQQQDTQNEQQDAITDESRFYHDGNEVSEESDDGSSSNTDNSAVDVPVVDASTTSSATVTDDIGKEQAIDSFSRMNDSVGAPNGSGDDNDDNNNDLKDNNATSRDDTVTTETIQSESDTTRDDQNSSLHNESDTETTNDVTAVDHNDDQKDELDTWAQEVDDTYVSSTNSVHFLDQQHSVSNSPSSDSNSLTSEVKNTLIKNLKYHRKEVDNMKPDIALYVAYKKLMRPTEGIPINWYRPGHVDESTTGSDNKINTVVAMIVINVVVPIAVGTAALTLATQFFNVNIQDNMNTIEQIVINGIVTSKRTMKRIVVQTRQWLAQKANSRCSKKRSNDDNSNNNKATNNIEENEATSESL